MAQRSITSFFGAKSPPQSSASGTTGAKEESSEERDIKKVLTSPTNKPQLPASPSKPTQIEKAKTQLVLQASPQKMLVAASPKKKTPTETDKTKKQAAKSKKKVSISPGTPESDSNKASPKSEAEESENSMPEAKVIRKRRRLSSTSSSSSASSVSSKSSHTSLSTDYNDLDQMEVDAEESVTTKSKKKPAAQKKAAAAEKPKKAKSPAVKKKTPAKTAKVDDKTPKPQAVKKEEKPTIEVKEEDTPKPEGKTASIFGKPASAKNDSKNAKEEPTSSKAKEEPFQASTATPGEYDPMQDKYDPVTSASWKLGEKTPFLCLALTLDCAEKTSSRLRTMETVANFFSSIIRLSPSDLPATVYLCLGIVAPAHLGIETSVGEGALLKAIASATGRPIAKIRADLQQKGDLGEVAETSRQVQPKLGFAMKPVALTISGVFAKLREIAAMHGASSMTQRIDTISRLLTTCQPVEAKFLVRLLTGKLRVGLAEQSVLIALAHAAIYARCKTPKERTKYWEDKAILDSVAKSLRLAFAHCPDVDRVAKALLEAVNADSEEDFMGPLLELPKKCPIVPGLPVKPMLAQPAKSLHEIVEKLGEQAKAELEALPGDEASKPGRIFACEYKYDGERAQIHVSFPEASDKPVVKIYSRNQEDHTVRFSEVANRIATEAVLPDARGKNLIIDSEIVAIDSSGRHLPFQMLAARKRKETNPEDEEKEAKKQAAKVEKDQQKGLNSCAPPPPSSAPAYQAIAFVFDCIFIDGQSLVADTLLERRRKIRECIKPIDGLVEWAVSFEIDIDKQEHEVEEKVGQWLEKSVQDGCEGLIVKTATSKYMVARRAPCWLKLKKDYIDTEGSSGAAGMGGDSVDLVVVAGYWGAGKRTGRLGAFLLASYDALDDQYETVCKLGTGLSEEVLDQLTEQLMPMARPQGAPAPTYVKRTQGLPEPNVWLEPSVVWEVRAADLSLSNIHTSGLGSIPGAPDRGVSLRFPRYVRARPDKKPEEATTSENMCRRYANQQQVQNAADGKTKTAVDDDFY